MVSFFAPFPFVVFTAYFLLLILQFSIDSLEFLWVLIELLTFVIIGLIFITACSSTTMFGATIYFITQSILSIIFLALVFFMRFNIVNSLFVLFLFFLVLYINIGGFPFHSWYYSSVYPFPSIIFLLVLTFHKTPLLVSFLIVFTSFNLLADLQQFVFLVIILNLLALGVFSLVSADLRSLILSTSLANNSWLLLSCFSGSTIMVIYVTTYFMLISIVLSWNSSVSYWSLISLSGLPPFPIFFLKLFILMMVTSNLSFMSSLLFCSLIMFFTLLVSFSYLRFTFSAILIKSLLGSILYINESDCYSAEPVYGLPSMGGIAALFGVVLIFFVSSVSLIGSLISLEIFSFFLLFLAASINVFYLGGYFLLLIYFIIFVLEGVIGILSLVSLVSYVGTDYLSVTSFSLW